MIYAIVFVGSFALIALLVGVRFVLRQRGVRRFVRSVKTRLQSAEERGAVLVDETPIVKPPKNPRASAIELQKVRSLLRVVDKTWAQGKTDEVELLLIQALTINPSAHEARAQLAKLYVTTGRESKAEAMYKELLLHRSDASFHANLGLAYYRQEKYIEACHAYQDALNLEPKNPERSAALGRACIAAQRFEEAAPLLEKASAFLSKDIELMHMLAECYLQLNNREKAEEVYRRINKLEPYNEDVKSKLQAMEAAAAETETANSL